MPKGWMYCAPLTSDKPTHNVSKGKFNDVLPKGWFDLGPVHKFEHEITTSPGVTLIASHQEHRLRVKGLLGARANIIPVPAQIMFEHQGADERFYCKSVTVESVSVQKTNNLEWVFLLDEPGETLIAGSAKMPLAATLTTTPLPTQQPSSGWASGGGQWIPLGAAVTSMTFTTSGTFATGFGGGIFYYSTPAPPAAGPPAYLSATGKGSIPDLVPGRLRGYREWRIAPPDGLRPTRLVSITADTVWPWTPEFRAQCHRAAIADNANNGFGPGPAHDPDDVPHPMCSCGIYAKFRPIIGSGRPDFATGIVEAWGDIEYGDDAFRAQFARLVALYKTTLSPSVEAFLISARISIAADSINELGEIYHVPVFDSLDEALKVYPPSDMSAIGGEPGSTFKSCKNCGGNLVEVSAFLTCSTCGWIQ